jgi:ERCC4-related helicase
MSVKTPRMIDGMYSSVLSEQEVALIESIMVADKIEAFKHMAYNFDSEIVAKSIETGVSPVEMIKKGEIKLEDNIGTLRDYQTIMAAYMYVTRRSINGDYVGLGKTIETAATINYAARNGEKGRFLMAVKKDAVYQTMYEMIRFTGKNCVYLSGETAKLKRQLKEVDWSKVGGIVGGHSLLKSDTFMGLIRDHINPDGTNGLFDKLFIDESGIIKNPDTEFCRYISLILNITPRCHLLNATPFEKSIMEVYTQLDLVDSEMLPRKYRIEKEYSVYHRKPYWIKVGGKPTQQFRFDRVGYKNTEKFRHECRLRYFARCKADVGLDVQHSYKVYRVEMSKAQRDAIKGGHRYIEVLNCPSMVDIGLENTRKDVPKINRLCELIEEQYVDSKVMVYVWNPDAQHAIAEELSKIGRKPVVINGSDKAKPEERFRIQIELNSEKGSYDTLVTNARYSLNLQGVDVCIFYSTESGSGLYTQIGGRIDRNTSDKMKEFVMLLYADSAEEEYIMGTVVKRNKESRALTLDAESIIDKFMASMESSEGEE